MIYWQISIEKYVPKHLISLLSNFWYIFCRLYSRMNRWILKRYPPKWMILEVDVHKLSNYRSVKRFMCLKWILKNVSTILHSRLPVTPFKRRFLFFRFKFVLSEIGFKGEYPFLCWSFRNLCRVYSSRTSSFPGSSYPCGSISKVGFSLAN